MSWTHLSSREVRGRKEYTCDLCGLRIRCGAKHWKTVGVVDGWLTVARRHACCVQATKDWSVMDWDTPIDVFEFRYYELGLSR